MDRTFFQFDLERVDELMDRRCVSDISGTYAGVSELPEGATGRSRFSNTQIVMDRLAHHPDFHAPSDSDPDAPYGRFRGKHVIGTGTRVLGGVYLGHKPREAIFVDPQSAVLNDLLQWFIDSRFSVMKHNCISGKISMEITPASLVREFSNGLALALYEFTRQRLVFNESAAAQVSRAANIKPDEELTLDAYVNAKVGVCRHQVLLLVALFEKLEPKYLTKGKMTVCRCYIPHMFSHAWARYELSGEESLILDPAQNFCGTHAQGGDMGQYIYNHEFARILESP